MLNYKDVLVIIGKGLVVRIFFMIFGIDFVGIVIEFKSDEFKVGDKVLLNGFGVGEKYLGGLSEKVFMSVDWFIFLFINLILK